MGIFQEHQGRYLCRASQRCLEFVKTRMGGRVPEASKSRSAMSLPASLPTNTRRCCTEAAALLRSPTVTRTGCFSRLLASSSTFSGSVALKNAATCGKFQGVPHVSLIHNCHDISAGIHDGCQDTVCVSLQGVIGVFGRHAKQAYKHSAGCRG